MGDIHGIPDDVLELILLRVASPVHVTRAAATCWRWHGIVACAGFLRRFGSLDGGRKLVAGSFYNGRFFPDFSERERPAFVASSSLPAAAGGRFSLDFLWSDDGVDPTFWRIVDSRGGLLLWAFEERYDDYDLCPTWRMHMVICEPLTRRYRRIPPMVRSVLYDLHSGPFLLDGDGHAKAAASGGVGVDLSSFRVMCVVGDRRSDRYRGSMFNSRGRDHGSWQGYSVRWEGRPRHFMGHTRASLYWHAGGGTVESLDRSKAAAAEVSSSRLPAGMEDWDAEYTQLKVAAGRDGEARVLAAGASSGVIKVFAQTQGGGGHWALEKTIELPAAAARGLPGYRASSSYFSGEAAAAVAHVKVTDTALVVVSRWKELWAHRVDVETGEAELVPDEDACCDVAFPCELPWPPVLRRHRAREQLPVGGV